MERLNLQVVAVLKPLEIKPHTVPHLKGLNSGLEPLTKCEHGSTFTLHHTTLKSAHFPYKQAEQQFHMNIALVPVRAHTFLPCICRISSQ